MAVIRAPFLAPMIRTAEAMWWRENALAHEQRAVKALRDGGRLTEWAETYNGLETRSDLVLYCWLKYWEARCSIDDDTR